jgi:hypothetical protein
MYSNPLVILTIIIVIISLSNAKTIFVDNNHFELTGENASVFLHNPTDGDHASHLDKREFGKNCVGCKFGINPCCEPNICINKKFWPDECMEIKQAKKFQSN